MATNTYVFPTGNLTGFTNNPTLDELIVRQGIDVVRSPTQQAYPGAGGTQIRINGVALTYDAAGHITGGFVTSIQAVTIDQFNNVTIQEQTTGFVALGANFQAALNISTLDAIKLVMAGNDTVNGSIGNDHIQGHDGNDALNGNAGDDLIEGGNGNDVLNGGLGDDTFVGGNGNDTYSGGTGFDTIDSSDSYGNPSAVTGITVVQAAGAMLNFQGGVENFTSIESFIGTQFVDTFLGAGGNDTFRGLGGNDILSGGAGSDTAGYDLDAGKGGIAGVTVDLTAGTATDGFGNTDTLISIENVIGTQADDNITGSTASNLLRGLGGNDTLTAVAGAGDVLRGGAGNDIYNISALNQLVDEAGDNGSGIDEVRSSVSFSLNAPFVLGDVENLTLTGAAIIGIGNDLDNIIKGNAANNFLTGGSGNDTITGDAGNDNITGDGGNDNLDGGTGDDTINGGLGNDIMVGGTGDDTLNGGEGNDSLDGGDGGNHLDGGLGNDTYALGAKADGEDSITDAGGSDTVTSTIDRSLAFYTGTIENLTLLGTAVNGTGNAADNTITGNDGNNNLFGLAGNDILLGGLGDDFLSGGLGDDDMQGGGGNDTYLLDGNDSITDTGGVDLATSLVQSINLNVFSGVENATLLGGGNLAIIGNGGNNVLTGNVGNNVILGGIGNDLLIGGVGNDNLQGGIGNDRILGGDDDDTINGGLGIDTLTGGTGNDRFNFLNAPGLANRDIITDFNHTQDTMGLSHIFFAKLGAAVSATELRLGTHAVDANDFLVYDRPHGNLFYDSNANAAGGQILFATLSNHAAINFTDFAIV